MATFWSNLGLPTRDSLPRTGFPVLEWDPPTKGRSVPGHFTADGNTAFIRFLELVRDTFTFDRGRETININEWRWRLYLAPSDSTSGLARGDDLSAAVEGEGLTMYHVRESASGTFTTRRTVNLDLSSPDNTEPYAPQVDIAAVGTFVNGYRGDRPGSGATDYILYRLTDGQTLDFGSGRINRTGTAGENFSYQLPAATGWPSGVRYSATGLPPGLSFNANTRTISGSPTSDGAWDVTVTARVSQGVLTGDTTSYTTSESATRTVRITISAATPTLTVRSIANRNNRVGDTVSFTAGGADWSGGTPTGLTYSATGLPPGIALSGGTLFSGSPTTEGTYTVVYSASAPGYTGDSETFTWTIGAALALALGDISNKTNFQDSRITTFTGPAATAPPPAGGRDQPTFTYTATGLPPGITFTASTRRFSGTPTSQGTYTVTYRAAADDGPWTDAVRTFTWTIEAPPFLTLGTALDRSGLSGNAVNFRGPAATPSEGNPTIRYSADGLPPGVSFNANTRRFTGAPSAGGDYTVEYEARAVGYINARTTFTWTVTDRILTVGAIANRSDERGSAITAFTGPAASANTGSPSVTYRASDLPPGIRFNTSTRVFSGSPTQTGTYLCNYSVSATNYRSATRSWRWEITAPDALTLPSLSARDSTVNAPISSWRVPAATASSGSPSITYSASGLPAGISFNANTRTFSGTPTRTRAYTVTVTASASGYESASQSFRWTISNLPTLFLADIADRTSFTGTPITRFTGPAATAGSRDQPTITYTVEGLPPGVSFNGSNRRFSGTPTGGSNTFNVRYRASAEDYADVIEDFTWTITESSLSLAAIDNQTSISGTAITALTIPAATANRGSPSITYSATGMPAGISFSASQRRFSGSPTTAGTSTVTVTASAAGYASASRTFTWTVGGTPALSLSAITGLSGFTGDSVSFTGPAAAANTGSPSVTYSVTGLPPGVSFNASTRAFSGAPTTAGDFTVEYTASASGYETASRAFSWTVTEKTLSVAFIQTQTTTANTATTAFNGPIATANTGSPTVTYSASGLPPGISFTASSRRFSGTPTTAGSYSVTYRARAAGYTDGSTTFTWTVSAGKSLSLASINNRTSTVGTRTTFTAPAASASTGSPSISYSVTGLPPGLSRSGRILSGSPTTAGSYTVRYTASASGYASATATFTWTIREALALSVTAIADRADETLSAITGWTGPAAAANRGSPSVTYRADGLPPGVSFNASTRRFSGTPTQTGTWTVTYRSSASGYIGSRTQFTWTITAGTPTGTLSFHYTIAPQWMYTGNPRTLGQLPGATASSGSPTITYSATGLPPGVTFNANTRTFGGTPTTAGSYQTSFTASAPNYGTASVRWSWTIVQSALTLGSIADQDDSADSQITALTIPAARANNRSPTVTYTATGLPPGIAFSGSQRTFSGTPTTEGTWTVTVTAAAAGFTSASQSFTWNISITPSLSLGGINNRAGHTGDTIITFHGPAATFNTGSPSVTYSVTGLPAGISFSASQRAFSGAPTTAGVSTVTYTASAAGYVSASVSFTWTVTQKTLSLAGISDRSSTEGTAISAFAAPSASANAGAPTITYSAAGMPAGISFSAAQRRFSGVPSAAGVSIVTVTATADGYTSASTSFTWTVRVAPVLSVGAISDQSGTAGDTITAFTGPAASASTGSPSVSYSVTGLPPGIAFSASQRRFSGTPTGSDGTWTVTYTARASGYRAASTTFTWTVSGRELSVGTIADRTETVDIGITGFAGPLATASTGSPTIDYSVTGLPPGIAFNTTSRRFTGRATATGSYTVTYTARASGFQPASTTFTWRVDYVPAVTFTAGTRATGAIRGFRLAGRFTAGARFSAQLRGGLLPAARFSVGTHFAPATGQVVRSLPRARFTAGALLRSAALDQNKSLQARFRARAVMRPTIVTFGAPGYQILDIGTPTSHSVVAGVQLFSWDLTIGTPQWNPLDQTLVADGSTDTYVEQLFLSWHPALFDDTDTQIAESEARMGIYLTGTSDLTRQIEDAESAFSFEAPALDLLVIPGLGQISGTDPSEPYVYRFTGTTASTVGDWIEQYSSLTPQELSGTRFILDDNRRELVGVFTAGTHTRFSISQRPEIVTVEPSARFQVGAKVKSAIIERASFRGHTQTLDLDDRDVFNNTTDRLRWTPAIPPGSFESPSIDPELRNEPSLANHLVLIGFDLRPPDEDAAIGRTVQLQTINLDFNNPNRARDLSVAFESRGTLTFACGTGADMATLALTIGTDLRDDATHPYDWELKNDDVLTRVQAWITAWRALPEGGRNTTVTLSSPDGQFLQFRMRAGTRMRAPIHQQSERRNIPEMRAQVGTRFAPAIVQTEAFPPNIDARLYRYAIHIPGTDRGRPWAFWSGSDTVTLENVVYTAGQWAGFEQGAPLTGIHSTPLGGVEAMTLRFAATGLFRTWLLSGDAAGRIASVFSVAATGRTWTVKNEVVRGRIGDTRTLDNGLIEAEFSAAARSNANFPSVITYGVHKAEFEGDTSARFTTELDAGFKVDFP